MAQVERLVGPEEEQLRQLDARGDKQPLGERRELGAADVGDCERAVDGRAHSQAEPVDERDLLVGLRITPVIALQVGVLEREQRVH